MLNNKESKRKSLKTRILSFLLSVVITAGAFAGMPAEKVQAASTLYWPVPGHTRLSQGLHGGNAIDISDGSIGGADVIAAIGGKVTHIYLCGTQHYGSYHDCNGFGTGIVIAGSDGRTYQYAHMQANSIPSNVYYGAYVSSGQKIGRVGTTGNSSGNHLHFGISIGNYWNASGINPANEKYIYKSVTTNYNVTYSGLKTTFVNNTNAGLYGQINNPGRYTVTHVGAQIWDSKGNLVVNHSEYCGLNYSTIYQQLNINTEAKRSLKAGTTYQYRFWAYANNRYYYSSTAKFTTTKPAVKAPALSKGNITKLYSPSKNTMYIYWKKDKNATGYQLQYSTTSSFKSYRGYRITKNSLTALGIRTSYMSSKRYCYVRIRSYKQVGSKMTYGKWSTMKSVRLK